MLLQVNDLEAETLEMNSFKMQDATLWWHVVSRTDLLSRTLADPRDPEIIQWSLVL
jgi:hypothetical protein